MRSAGWVTGALAVAAAAGWELGAHAWASPVFPPLSAVLSMAVHLASEGSLATDILASLGRVLTGYSLAAVFGVALGSLAALGGGATAFLRAVVATMRPIPPIAWVPLAILWFGLGDPSARFIVFVGAFSPIFVQTTWALQRCPPAWLELAHSLGASPWFVFWHFRLPAAAPGIVAGLRTGLGLAWTSVIAAELVGARSGLGYRIQMHRVVLETDGVMVGMVCIGLCGLAMDALARAFERRFVGWTP